MASGLLLMSRPGHARTLEDLEKQLAREPPISTPFVEYHFSRVLKRPAQARGTLEYDKDAVLVRNVESPYRERTEVSGETVSVRRENKPERRFSLQRAPQLRVLLGSFRALLDGRLSGLRDDFDVRFDDGGHGWVITLTPHDATLARHVGSLRVDGVDDRPVCLESATADGASYTLLGGNLPTADAPTRDSLEKFCRAPAAP